jgi:hypothetical protein
MVLGGGISCLPVRLLRFSEGNDHAVRSAQQGLKEPLKASPKTLFLFVLEQTSLILLNLGGATSL